MCGSQAQTSQDPIWRFDLCLLLGIRLRANWSDVQGCVGGTHDVGQAQQQCRRLRTDAWAGSCAGERFVSMPAQAHRGGRCSTRVLVVRVVQLEL